MAEIGPVQLISIGFERGANFEGRIIDELEELGYVERRPERRDRRAKRVVPTERGREVMRVSDEIIRDIERRQADVHGIATYDDFKRDATRSR